MFVEVQPDNAATLLMANFMAMQSTIEMYDQTHFLALLQLWGITNSNATESWRTEAYASNGGTQGPVASEIVASSNMRTLEATKETILRGRYRDRLASASNGNELALAGMEIGACLRTQTRCRA